jgi:hypothetical protein
VGLGTRERAPTPPSRAVPSRAPRCGHAGSVEILTPDDVQYVGYNNCPTPVVALQTCTPGTASTIKSAFVNGPNPGQVVSLLQPSEMEVGTTAATAAIVQCLNKPNNGVWHSWNAASSFNYAAGQGALSSRWKGSLEFNIYQPCGGAVAIGNAQTGMLLGMPLSRVTRLGYRVMRQAADPPGGGSTFDFLHMGIEYATPVTPPSSITLDQGRLLYYADTAQNQWVEVNAISANPPPNPYRATNQAVWSRTSSSGAPATGTTCVRPNFCSAQQVWLGPSAIYPNSAPRGGRGFRVITLAVARPAPRSLPRTRRPTHRRIPRQLACQPLHLAPMG